MFNTHGWGFGKHFDKVVWGSFKGLCTKYFYLRCNCKKTNFRIQYIPSLYLIGYTKIIDFCEIMLKLALNTNQSINQFIFFNNFCFFVILGIHILHFNTEKNIMKFLYHYDQLNCYTVHFVFFVFVQYVS